MEYVMTNSYKLTNGWLADWLNDLMNSELFIYETLLIIADIMG